MNSNEKNDVLKMNRDDCNVGYFATLKLKFYATDEDIKKNFAELYPQFYCIGEREAQTKEDEEKFEIFQRINSAYAVLEDKLTRAGYLHMLSIRYFLITPVSLDEVESMNSGRIFCCNMFEVLKKSGTSYNLILLSFDFINRTFVESRNCQVIKGYNFSSLLGAAPGAKKDEFSLNLVDPKSFSINFYKVKYPPHRDLIVQIALLAKEVQDKRTSQLIHLQNPNTENFITEKISRERQSSVKLIMDDRIIPGKSLAKHTVFKKGGFLEMEKKYHLILGNRLILLSKDENANQIMRAIPMAKDFVSISKMKSNDTLCINYYEEKINLRFVHESEANNFQHEFSKIIEADQISSDTHTIISLPYLSKDIFVMKFKKDKLKQIKLKIEETEKYLETLRLAKEKLESELVISEESKHKKNFTLEPDSPKEVEESDAKQLDIMHQASENIGEAEEPAANREDLIRRTSQKIKSFYFKSHNLI